MAATQRFRSALNGFNREDVVNYIEYLNNQHNAKLEQLNNQLQQAKENVSADLVMELQAQLLPVHPGREPEELHGRVPGRACSQRSNAQEIQGQRVQCLPGYAEAEADGDIYESKAREGAAAPGGSGRPGSHRRGTVPVPGAA